MLDRWSVKIVEEKTEKFPAREGHKFMMNYSIGYDAKVAYEFHMMRQENPEKYCSQFVNKLRYAVWQVWLEVDGKDIEIPKGNMVMTNNPRMIQMHHIGLV